MDGDQKKHRGRGWLIAGLVVVAIAAALGIGYVLGGNSRDDDVNSAKANAAKANAQNEQTQQNAEQAAGAIEQGFNDLGTAISQEEAKDDQQAQQAVDDATNEIQSGFEQLGEDFGKKVENALSDLKDRINEAAAKNSEQSSAG